MKPAFKVKEFVEKLATFIDRNPDQAYNAYLRAAEKMRNEAQKNIQERVHLRALAERLDQLALSTKITETEECLGEAMLEEMIGKESVDGELTTDWKDIVEDFAAAKVDEHGNPRSEFAAAAALQRTFSKNDTGGNSGNEKDSGFRLTPASATSGTTNFGSSVLCRYSGNNTSTGSFSSGTTANNIATFQEAQVIRWDGREHESQNVTVTINNPGVVFPYGGAFDSNQAYTAFPGANYAGFNSNAYTTNYIFRPYFHMIWGTSKGVPNEVYADIGCGRQLTVAASFLYLNVGMSYRTGMLTQGGAATTPGAMMLGASMGFYNIVRTAPLTLTWYDMRLGDLAPIPPFAATIEAFYTTAPANWQVFFQNAIGDTIGIVNLVSLQNRAAPIPGDAIAVAAARLGYGVSSIPVSTNLDRASIVFGLAV